MEILKLALKTVEEMFEDRNYVRIDDKTSLNTDILVRVPNSKYITPAGKLATVFIISSTSSIKSYADMIEDYETILFIYPNMINTSHKTVEKKYLNNVVEIWSVYDLMCNISKHVMQPLYIKLVSKKHVIDSFGKIPKIHHYDPLMRYYKFKPKDVIEIKHRDGNILYRVVI